MAAAARIDLHDLRAAALNAGGVLRRKEVSLDHRNAQIRSELRKGLLEERGLARAGRAEEVQRINPAAGKKRRILRSRRIVAAKNIRLDNYLHGPIPSL